MMLIPKNIDDLTQLLLKKITFYDALQQLGMTPVAFFKALDRDADLKLEFERCRQIIFEMALDESLNALGSCTDKFGLDKSIAKLRAHQWMVEKLIPKTYGQKVEVSGTLNIDIRGILARAESRVIEGNAVRVLSSDSCIVKEPLGLERGEKGIETLEVLSAQDLIGG